MAYFRCVPLPQIPRHLVDSMRTIFHTTNSNHARNFDISNKISKSYSSLLRNRAIFFTSHYMIVLRLRRTNMHRRRLVPRPNISSIHLPAMRVLPTNYPVFIPDNLRTAAKPPPVAGPTGTPTFRVQRVDARVGKTPAVVVWLPIRRDLPAMREL